jgi:hypothetical protein
MIHRVAMKDCMSLLQRMARETRARHSVGPNIVISPYMEQDYGIKIVYDPNALMKAVDEPSESYIEFASAAQYTMLVLKYL